jgi:hypothetical protein
MRPAGYATSRQILLALAGVSVGMAFMGALLFLGYANRAVPDSRRVAVAPFDVMVERPDLSGARVGLAVAVTRALEASGSVTAVPQSQVAQVWRARATPFISAIELARRTGAGLAVYGRVDPWPGDSVWVRAAVLDSHSTRGLFEVEALTATDALDRAADSVAAMIVRRLRES